jgi:translation elongation factor EF-Tu-like GTPase
MNTSFHMIITHVFDLKGRGIIIDGEAQTGILRTGDTVRIYGQGQPDIITQVNGIGILNVSPGIPRYMSPLFFRHIDPSQIVAGMVIEAQPQPSDAAPRLDARKSVMARLKTCVSKVSAWARTVWGS